MVVLLTSSAWTVKENVKEIIIIYVISPHCLYGGIHKRGLFNIL